MQVLQGLFGGTGMLTGNLYNNAVVAPGDAPGVLRLNGNYYQASGAALQIGIGGRGINQYDLLSVGGVAVLNGELQITPIRGFKLKLNQPVTFLTAGGGIIGRFTSIEDGFSRDNILVPTVVYHSNSVALEAEQGSFLEFAENTGLTSNQRAVAGALDSAAGDRRAGSLFNFLDYESFDRLPKDLEKILPEELTSIFTTSIAYAQQQSLNLQRRTDDIRSGSSGFSAANLAINGDNPFYSGGFDVTTGVAGPSGDDGKEMKETKKVTPAENRWGAFVSGTGEWVNVSGTENARGYDLASGGFTLGVDYKVTSNFAVGLAAGYTGTTANLNDHGRVWVNGGKLGLYSTAFSGGWYADVAAFGGYNGYDTRRSALEGDARGSTHGGEIDALFGTGYDFKKGNLTFGPTGSFNYTYAGYNQFDEHGSLAPLNIHAGDAASLRTAFGVKVSYAWKVGGMIIKPELRAAWQHEFGDATYALTSSFADGAGNPFTTSGPKFGRDSALIGAGFAVQFNDRCSAYLYYDGDIGRTNYQSESVTGGFRVTF
jgi:outer membrane autotransporter protein